MSELNALIYSIQYSGIAFDKACFMNGQYDMLIEDILPASKTFIVTPYIHHLKNFLIHKYQGGAHFPDSAQYDACFILLPKQKDQALYDIAYALQHLSDGGHLVLCAHKNAGGSRLANILKVFGLEADHGLSKFHCKSVVVRKTSALQKSSVLYCLQKGEQQKNQFGYYTKPGIFGWNKIDTGSELLSHYITDELSGIGADFGCGYGYLTDKVFQTAPNIDVMDCYDVDHHALDACRANMRARHPDKRTSIIWHDLTLGAPNEGPSGRYQFVVMNPPFHDGKASDHAMGQKMIKTAYDMLGKYGALFMVANNHLPYEKILEQLFFKVEILTQEKGFKIFKALK